MPADTVCQERARTKTSHTIGLRRAPWGLSSGDDMACDRKGKQTMFYLPPELALASEETTVVGDIDAFIEYVESGQALRDWHERLAILTEECDTFLREHSHVWSHIIIQPQKPTVESPQAA
jgi:hypothetical protein